MNGAYVPPTTGASAKLGLYGVSASIQTQTAGGQEMKCGQAVTVCWTSAAQYFPLNQSYLQPEIIDKTSL
jgi:hypothetical protein